MGKSRTEWAGADEYGGHTTILAVIWRTLVRIITLGRIIP